MIHFSSPRSVRRQHVGGPASLVRSKGSYMSPEHSMPDSLDQRLDSIARHPFRAGTRSPTGGT